MVDTGSNRNYISGELAGNAVDVTFPFYASSPVGSVKITKKVVGPFLKFIDIDSPITLFVLPKLTEFEGIIGDDTLKELHAVVDRKKSFANFRKWGKFSIKAEIFKSPIYHL